MSEEELQTRIIDSLRADKTGRWVDAATKYVLRMTNGKHPTLSDLFANGADGMKAAILPEIVQAIYANNIGMLGGE